MDTRASLSRVPIKGLPLAWPRLVGLLAHFARAPKLDGVVAILALRALAAAGAMLRGFVRVLHRFPLDCHSRRGHADRVRVLDATLRLHGLEAPINCAAFGNDRAPDVLGGAPRNGAAPTKRLSRSVGAACPTVAE